MEVSILDFIEPILTAFVALMGVVGASKLMDYRIGQLEGDFRKFSNHIESLITLQVDLGNVKDEINEFKAKEEKDRQEIREDIDELQQDVGVIKEKVGDLQVKVTKVEGEVETIRTTVKLHHG